MKGILAVNEFVRSEKFAGLFGMLTDAAKRCGVELTKKTGAQIWADMGRTSYKRPDVDFCLFWDKDVRLAEALEISGLRVFNSSRAIADCDDKSLTYLKLQAAGIRQPESFISPKKFHADGLLSEEFLDAAAESLGYPLVFKECFGSFGAEVSLVKDREALIKKAIETGDRPYMLQRYIAESEGCDVRIQIVGGRVVTSMKRLNDNDFRANITNGGRMEKFEPDDEMKALAINAAEVLKLDFAGVDVLFGNDGPYICEVNSNAHFKNLYDCTGVNTADHILQHIKDSLG